MFLFTSIPMYTQKLTSEKKVHYQLSSVCAYTSSYNTTNSCVHFLFGYLHSTRNTRKTWVLCLRTLHSNIRNYICSIIIMTMLMKYKYLNKQNLLTLRCMMMSAFHTHIRDVSNDEFKHIIYPSNKPLI